MASMELAVMTLLAARVGNEHSDPLRTLNVNHAGGWVSWDSKKYGLAPAP